MGSYSNLSDKELESVYEDFIRLTFGSKIKLKKELENRMHFDLAKNLQKNINIDLAEIEELKFLEWIGYKFSKISNETYNLKRSMKAIFIDILAVLMGFIFTLIGVIFGIARLFSSFQANEVNMSSVVFSLIFSVLGVYGLLLFFRGANRLFDLSEISCTKALDIITLKKRKDLRLVTIEANKSEINLVTKEDRVLLNLGKETIISGNANKLVHVLTMKELYNRLRN